MEPQDALWTDRSVFESELDGLIDSAIKSETSPSLKRPAVQDHPSKRVKTEQEPEDFEPIENYSLHVHPSRKVLLDRPDAPKVRDRSSPSGRWDHNRFASTLNPISNHNNLGNVPMHRQSSRNGRPNGTWPTLSNTVRRQWDPRKDDIEYELLLEQRRKEKLQNVDRYVPDRQGRNKRPSSFSNGFSSEPSKVFPLDLLPEKIKLRIFGLLLISPDSITIDFYWLRPFVKGHARVPDVTQKVEHEGTTYALPVSWEKLLSDIELMRGDMLQFGGALETRGVKTKWTRSPCRGLSTGLLRVSRNIHKVAAQVFYGENIFKFPSATNAWMQLDSFLATIGSQNVASIQHIRIHVPLWHRGVQEDFVEGAVVDLLSPASRMAVIKPPPHDRLLSAIRHANQTLINSNLATFSLDLENGLAADYWSGRHSNEKRLISIAEADEFVERKHEGIELLKQVSEALAANQKRPLLSLLRPSKTAPLDKKEFRKRLPGLVAEAEKYGWEVDTYLRDLR